MITEWSVNFKAMNRNERLLAIAKHYNLKDSHFASRIGASKQNFYNWKSFKQEVPDKFLITIIEQFPELNARWLITGEGDINGVVNKENDSHLQEVIKLKDQIIQAKDELIQFLTK